MKCPFCSSENTRVIDSRPADDNNSIRRRRLCDDCGKRFTTYEKVETIPLIVIKKDNCREQYDRSKIEAGVLRACHKRPVVRGNGSRVLRTQEDWNEWQANTLGAAILMPQSEVDRAMWFINSRKPLTCYGWRFYNKDQVKIDTFCGVFGVSRSAAAIRLEQLGYLNRKKDYEYRDPLEVWP